MEVLLQLWLNLPFLLEIRNESDVTEEVVSFMPLKDNISQFVLRNEINIEMIFFNLCHHIWYRH